MRKSTKKVIQRWRKRILKIKNYNRRRSLEFMIDSIEDRIQRNLEELGENDGR
jgi:hypothetical protein